MVSRMSAERILTHYEASMLERAAPWFATVISGREPPGGDHSENAGRLLVLCMTPRSGSTALSAAMASTGVLGRGGELLNRKPGGEFERLVAGRRFPSRRALLHEVVDASRTPNGVGHIKVDLQHILPFLLDGGSLDLLKSARFVLLTRERMLSQAVSRYRGFQTGRWHAKGDEPASADTAPCDFDFDAIRKQLFFLSNMLAGYERVFATLGVRPLRLHYENVARDDGETIERIAALVGVSLDRRYGLAASGYSITATADNDVLQRRFVGDFRAVATEPLDVTRRTPDRNAMAQYPKTAEVALTSYERGVLRDAATWFENAGLADAGAVPTDAAEDLLLLCMTPRSGSSALSSVITKTGLLGRGGERLNRKSGGPLEKLLAEGSHASRASLLDEAIRRSRTANGVGHVKCDFAQIYPFLMDKACHPRLVKARWVYLTRDDLLGQAISRYRGNRSGFWHASGDTSASPDVPYDFEGIRAQIVYLAEMAAAYERVFAAFDIRPLRITYEMVVADTSDVVRRIADHVGVALTDAVSLEDGGHKRVSTDNNAELRRRFVADAVAALDLPSA